MKQEQGSKRARKEAREVNCNMYEYPTDDHCIGVGPSCCLHLLLPQPQNILQSVQSNLEISLREKLDKKEGF